MLQHMQSRRSSRASIGRHIVRCGLIALLALTAFGNLGIAPPASASGERLYQATGYSVKGPFLRYFDRYGGLTIFGYPITGEVVENGRTVQYFERQRLEYRKEAAGTSQEVQGSLLGRELAQGKVSLAPIQPFNSTPTRLYIRETGHSLGQPFLNFWNAYGGIKVFGYPISEPVSQNGRMVQYFERARMEYSPNLVRANYGIELGHLGREYLQARARLHAPAALSGLEQQLLDHINKARRDVGLQPVSVDGKLTELSRARSKDMATRGYFSHVTPEGTDFMHMLRSHNVPFKFCGEIIASNNYSREETVGHAYHGFMNSPSHRPLILDARYNVVGVGEALDGKGYYYFTVIFVQR